MRRFSIASVAVLAFLVWASCQGRAAAQGKSGVRGVLYLDAPKPPYLTAMEGTWSAVSQTKDGKAIAADQLSEERLVIKGKHWRVLENGKFVRTESHLFVHKGKTKPEMLLVTFDPAATPKKTISFNLSLGIYELEGDQLKICLAPFGKDRPTEFKAPAGSRLTLTVYKRVKEAKGK